MNEPTISIVVPAYNVEKFIGEALQSIKDQTKAPDELIIINDGSTDNTLSIADSYSFPFTYQVLSIENGGQGNARNIGANLASSEYIYYFDSDDVLDKNFIKNIKRAIKENNRPDIILFSGESFNDSDYQGKRWVDYSRGFSGYFQNRIDFLDTALKHSGLFCSPCLYVSKKKLWGEAGVKFGSGYLEDEAIFFPLIFLCNTYYVLDEVFFYRRNRDGSTMTMNFNLKHVDGALNCIDKSLELLQNKNLTKIEQWHVKKRLESHITSYIGIARIAQEKVLYSRVFNAILSLKSIRSFGICLLYLLRVNELLIAKKIRKALRELIAKIRS